MSNTQIYSRCGDDDADIVPCDHLSGILSE